MAGAHGHAFCMQGTVYGHQDVLPAPSVLTGTPGPTLKKLAATGNLRTTFKVPRDAVGV